jgi:hypothetical protein
MGAGLRQQRGGGTKHALFFTAGPLDESHGLFGSLVAAGPPGHDKNDE